VNEQVNQRLQKTALQRLLAYQREGNQALGVYNDKSDPTEVPQQFAYMLSYDKALLQHLPDFYHYLLAYPDARPASVEDTFYWAKVKFGLKPTLRVLQMVTMDAVGSEDGPSASPCRLSGYVCMGPARLTQRQYTKKWGECSTWNKVTPKKSEAAKPV
jgi:hypothetical protein